jgi:hypothetical protein
MSAASVMLSTMGTLVEVRRDGKLYPPVMRSAAEVTQLRELEHMLHCQLGLSIRATQAVMLGKYGIRRSRGMIHRDLQRFQCPRCTPEPVPPRVKPQVMPWR